jgi:hypothetical protein
MPTLVSTESTACGKKRFPVKKTLVTTQGNRSNLHSALRKKSTHDPRTPRYAGKARAAQRLKNTHTGEESNEEESLYISGYHVICNHLRLCFHEPVNNGKAASFQRNLNTELPAVVPALPLN